MNTQPENKDREIKIGREFDAPRELVFDSWTSPEKICQWWGPEGFSTTTKEKRPEKGLFY